MLNKKLKIYIIEYSYISGGPYAFFKAIYPYLQNEFEITHDITENNIDIALINGTTISVNEIKQLKMNNPEIIIIHRIDERNDEMYYVNLFSDGSVFQSKFCRSLYKDFNHIKNETIIYNGTDITYLGDNQINKNILKILHVGWSFFDRKKFNKVFELIDHIEKINNVKMYTAGNYLNSNQFNIDTFEYNNKNLFNNYRNTEYLGFIKKDEKAKTFGSMDYLFFPSENDICPNLIIEAVQCGLPVIYSKNGGGVTELIENFGIPLENYNSYPEMINDLIINKNKYKENALRHINKYNINSCAKEYISFIKDIIRKKPNLKLGWILCGSKHVGSARLGGFLIHEQLLKIGINSKIIHYNNNFSIDTEKTLEELKDKINECNVIIFQKVCIGNAIEIANYCKQKGIKIIYSIGDQNETIMYNLSDGIIVSCPDFINFIKDKQPDSNPIYIEDPVEYQLKKDHKIHYSKQNMENLTIGWFGNWDKLENLNNIQTLLTDKDELITFSNTNLATYDMGHGREKPWDTSFIANKFLNEIDLAVLPIDTTKTKNFFKSANRLIFLLYLGIPTIVTPIPIYMKLGLIDKYNCYLADFNNTEAWRNALNNFRKRNIMERNHMSISAYHTVKENYNLLKVTKRYLSFITDILREKKCII